MAAVPVPRHCYILAGDIFEDKKGAFHARRIRLHRNSRRPSQTIHPSLADSPRASSGSNSNCTLPFSTPSRRPDPRSRRGLAHRHVGPQQRQGRRTLPHAAAPRAAVPRVAVDGGGWADVLEAHPRVGAPGGRARVGGHEEGRPRRWRGQQRRGSR